MEIYYVKLCNTLHGFSEIIVVFLLYDDILGADYNLFLSPNNSGSVHSGYVPLCKFKIIKLKTG